MRYLELFAGAGGMSHGFENAGLTCIGHAEIEPHARAVLRYRWPNTPLHGDVMTLTGEAGSCDLVSFGAPCQDLSVAGKRAGLGGARSSLFYQGIRLWHETNATYALYENVPGAFSSAKGADFAAVLSAFVGAAVVVPSDGWASAGVVAGPQAVAAWRVFDLQHFGPPQRRARVFVLAARAGGVDPAEVLALSDGVCGHPSPREQARQGAASGVGGGAPGGGVVGTLESRTNGGGFPGTDGAASGHIVAQPLAFHLTQDPITFDKRPQVTKGGFVQTLTTEGMRNPMSVVLPTMVKNGDQHTGFRDDGGLVVQCTTGDVTHALTHEGADAIEDGTGRGTPIVVGQSLALDDVLPCLPASLGGSPTGHNRDELIVVSGTQACANIGTDLAPCLNTMHEAPYVVAASDVYPALNTTHFGKHAGCNQHVTEMASVIGALQRPRRLTPKECEALMSWPRDWTRYGINEQGKQYELSDTARYKACGNGVGSVVAEWIGRRLMAMVAAC